MSQKTVTQTIDEQGFMQFEVEGQTVTMYRSEDGFDVYDEDGNKLGSGDIPGAAMLSTHFAIAAGIGRGLPAHECSEEEEEAEEAE